MLTVDNRGTGFKGRSFRNWVRDDLGRYETIDQINAAKEWAKRRYIDNKKVGIWGWVSRPNSLISCLRLTYSLDGTTCRVSAVSSLVKSLKPTLGSSPWAVGIKIMY